MAIECSEQYNEKPIKRTTMEQLSLMVESEVLNTATEIAEYYGIDRDQLIRNILTKAVSEMKDFI